MHSFISKSIERFKQITQKIQVFFERLLSRFNQFTNREKRILVVTLIVVFVLIMDGAVIRPLKANLKRLEEGIESQKKNVLWSSRTISQKPQVFSTYQELLQALNVSEKSPEGVRSTMLQDVEKIARDKDLYLVEVRPQVSVEKIGFTLYSVRIQAEGRMEALIEFFAELVRAKKLYYVDAFRVAPHVEDVNKIRATVTLSRIIFNDL